MCAKYYENPTMLSRVTAKNVGDVFSETHFINKRCYQTSKRQSRVKNANIPRHYRYGHDDDGLDGSLSTR